MLSLYFAPKHTEYFYTNELYVFSVASRLLSNSVTCDVISNIESSGSSLQSKENILVTTGQYIQQQYKLNN